MCIRDRNGNKPKLQYEFFNRLKTILEENSVTYDDKILMKLISRYYPDCRRLINEAQRFSAAGSINSSILIDIADIQIDDLIKALKNREFTVVRKWVVDNIDNDPVLILRRIYDSLYDYLKGPSIPEAVLIIAKYQQQVTQVADQEINILACLTEIMMS